ncbi:DUF2213 domain-containing protein [Halalkalicoccus sp. NIPERK01]|uniref:DUF2213 domain-containing protein n=1 Tax=Halalkalicoccus sp. NIPERK01 TaxID=3053469 RepID=UPI00256EAB3C|nr:DUF2213 domain-containing protein [Halalkalicoccus sp. NIPERK01]MDL5361359.1 DUF2213 domain-containing protein [Halalkalicoccus sp. NIPERK01]
MQSKYATQSATLAAQADEVRTEDLRGREHVVAPVTLVQEMVLKGEFLPLEEIEATQLAWNAKPSTITHPTNQSGDFVPASSPAQFESHAVATLFDVEASSASRALEGEVWIDRERSATVAEDLDRDDPAEMLLDDETVEVSVGYWYQRFEADGEHNGTEFDAVQVGVQPDHLALLPNSTGECSIEDGCGAGRDDAAGAAMNTQSGAPTSILQWGAQRLQNLGIDFGGACDGCGGTCDAHDGGGSDPNDTEDTMNDRIRELAEQSAFDAETLEEWDEDDLASLEASLDTSNSNNDGGSPTNNDNGADTDDAVLEELQSLREEMVTEDDVETIVSQKATEDKREDLIQDLVAHTGKDPEDYEDWGTEQLEAHAEVVVPNGGVYAGRSGGASSQSNSNDGSDIPIGVGDRYLEEAD